MEISIIAGKSFQIETNGKKLSTPFFFPSISSIKTNFKIEEYLNIIQKIGYPGFLISAYDIEKFDAKDQIARNVSYATNNNIFSLLDSGHYEAYWYHDEKWDFNKYEMILNKINVDLCFSYDIFWNDKKTVENHTIETIRAIAISAGMLKSGDTIPLLHFPILLLPRSIRELVQILSPKIIGIPERELGASLFERAYNIILIRKILDTSHKNILLHILGTGNPISILIYSLCGADSFDGLEWCQTVVNPETGHLFHFAQKDLLNCDCPYCCSDLGYPIQTLAHNLKFMKGFMESIQKSIQENESKRFARNYLDNRIVTKLIDFGAFK